VLTSYLTIHDLKDLDLLQKTDEKAILKEGEGWPMGNSKEFHDLIKSLLNQQVTLSSDYLEEAEANQIMKAGFLQGINPQLDQVIYSSAPDIVSYAQSFMILVKKMALKIWLLMHLPDNLTLRHYIH
jgi:hypothetical protein